VTGISEEEITKCVMEHIRNLILQKFDPKKADAIFEIESGVSVHTVHRGRNPSRRL
jgi:hypothetical protein